jgi:hypothetical protein
MMSVLSADALVQPREKATSNAGPIFDTETES